MPVRMSYVLRIGGRLAGAPNDPANAGIIQEYKKVLPRNYPVPVGTGTWTPGFTPAGYKVCSWYSELEPGGSQQQPETRISFRAELCLDPAMPGTIYENQSQLRNHFQWFCDHQPWHANLVQQLNNLNGVAPARVIERIWFREWQFYCGNGGDN